MAKFVTTTLLAAVISISTIAAQHQYTSSSDSDPEATALLELMDDFFKKSPRIQVIFEMTISIPGEKLISNKGSLDQDGSKYTIDIESYKIVCDGTIRWVYMLDQNEVNIYDATDEDGPSTPIDYLQLYRTNEFVYRISEEPVGYDEKSIEFKPLDKFSDYVKVRLTLKEDTGSPVGIELFEKGGQRTDLRISRITEAKKFPQDHFIFTPSEYPDIHIEDLRID